MSSAGSFAQDLPPKEGYRPFQIDRIPLRTWVTGRAALFGVLASTIVGHYIYFLNWKDEHRHILEMRSSRFALKPLLLAERDRAFLKQLKRNREEEKELMKYYPSWKVGTYYGEPIYRSLPEDQLVEPDAYEYYAHSHPDHYTKKHLYFMMT
ncbi:hypothetical protein KPH14_009364 [Odynerus spinipes]|uniref:NADH dehydrogenase [ubiquinone] 1 alpha subcomplex subunit 13 n=1 Tax=Odynerus spinipes TaxID=1348599 RepID=A0AAD9RQA8_9HYME|nr:hypothetical protein KPH14_009364 [Odynerus spinipes]